ncbi:MAG: single-stranded DNA-binding protein [Candidatus Omnitrophica bacterium]|nr:single-stranded DNA-binding protein [Candidatus Omnitrophota bacterium]
MASVNKVLLIGNLTRDPELRYLPSGSAVVNFSLAMNRVYKLQSGEKKEETAFVRVVVWGRQAELCGEYLKKGSSVFVEGRLQSRSWDTPDGQKRSMVEVVAMSVQFLRIQGAAQGAPLNKEREFSSDVPQGGKEEIGEIQLEEVPEGEPKGSGGEEVPF